MTARSGTERTRWSVTTILRNHYYATTRNGTTTCRCGKEPYPGDYCGTCKFWCCKDCILIARRESFTTQFECYSCQVGD